MLSLPFQYIWGQAIPGDATGLLPDKFKRVLKTPKVGNQPGKRVGVIVEVKLGVIVGALRVKRLVVVEVGGEEGRHGGGELSTDYGSELNELRAGVIRSIRSTNSLTASR